MMINYFRHSRFYHGAPVYTYKIVKAYPHDKTAYTQGLVYLNGLLYEGTGRTRQRRSMLGKVHLETGEVLQKIELPKLFQIRPVSYEDHKLELSCDLS